MADFLYKPVGRCIYCGDAELPGGVSRFGDEHIVPLAFGGTLILPEACCKRCEKVINQEIETPVLDREWGNFRAKHGFPTRNKKRRTEKLASSVMMGTSHLSPLAIPLVGHSTPVMMYKFKEARILSGAQRGDDNRDWGIPVIMTSRDDELAMQKNYPAWDQAHKLKAEPFTFARFVAKVAHSYAIAEYAKSDPDAFAPLLTDLILGRSDDRFFAVGGSLDIAPPLRVPGGTHTFKLRVLLRSSTGQRLADHALIIIDVRFFSGIESPSYHAVAGLVRFDNQKHFATFEKKRLDGEMISPPPGE